MVEERNLKRIAWKATRRKPKAKVIVIDASDWADVQAVCAHYLELIEAPAPGQTPEASPAITQHARSLSPAQQALMRGMLHGRETIAVPSVFSALARKGFVVDGVLTPIGKAVAEESDRLADG